MVRSAPIDGFALAYDRSGAGDAAVLLHGWPGDRHDWRAVRSELDGALDVIACDLRGFGESDKHPEDPERAYAADAQARSVLGLLDELGLARAVVAGYDVGGRVAQRLAADAPDRVRALVIGPPVPGAGERVLAPEAAREFWYQHFHRLALPEELIDGRPEAARAYLAHFWSHWSGPGFAPDDAELDRLADRYGAPGAFVASIAWYRAGAGTIALATTERPPPPERRIACPTTILWPGHDPLFPRAWGDQVHAYFADATIQDVADSGHFVPVEAPARFAAAIRAAAGSRHVAG